MIPFKNLPVHDYQGAADRLYEDAKIPENTVIAVLDDDPTGAQTVHDVPVYTNWEAETIDRAFASSDPIFFILTNSRSFTADKTEEVHRVIGERLKAYSEKSGKNYILISRGDSTLRGHWPLETETLAKAADGCFDGEILIPFFAEGGRFTINDVHHVKEGHFLYPVGMSDYAKDNTFGYSSSNLKDYINEKTEGRIKQSDVISVSLEELNSLNTESVVQKLISAENGRKIIVNAVCYEDLKVFFACFTKAIEAGKKFIFRTAASWIKICAKIEDRPLLDSVEIKAYDTRLNNKAGGIIIVGSHVKKTNDQLDALKKSGLPVEFVQFNVNYYSDLSAEAELVSSRVSEMLAAGKTVCVYTSRKVVAEGSNPEEKLRFAVHVSNSFVSVISRLRTQPGFIISKGGNTSSDLATKILKIKKATCLGQIAPGVPVWLCDEDALFGRIPFVIFPGNVGKADTLAYAVNTMLS